MIDVIICERASDWTAVLMTRLTAAGVRCEGVSELAEIEPRLAATGATVVALTLDVVPVDRPLEVVVAWLQRMSQAWPGVRLVVLSSHVYRGCEPLWYEAGAAYVASSTFDAPRAARAILRLAVARPGASTLRQEIWRQLPWAERVTAAKTS